MTGQYVIYSSAEEEAEAFWKSRSYLLAPGGGENERLHGFNDLMGNLSPKAQYIVSTWRDYGRDIVLDNASPSASMLSQSAVSNFNTRLNSIYSFASDDDELDEISVELDSAADEIRQYIADIYVKINELSNYWSGEAYDQFVSTCGMYKESLEGLVVLLEAFGKHFNLLYIDTDSLITKINDSLKECERSISSSN